MYAAVSRLTFIDALKAIASQLIVLHHLAFYGPMSDVANELAPAFISWLSQHARIAVQVFLVIGGFLAAKTLAPQGKLLADKPLSILHNRYCKLAIPYLAALLLAIVCTAVAGLLMDHHSIPGPPDVLQFGAHMLLLQSLLGFDSLSAGVWYIAIDFQLFALLLGTLWLARRLGGRINGTSLLGVFFVSLLAGAALFFFNRDPSWDNWALYFFGSYGLGVLTYWASMRKNTAGWLILLALAVALALLVDFRSRIAVSLCIALALGITQRTSTLERWPRSRLLSYLGKISYSVFLVNFPVALIINAIFTNLAPDNTLVNALGFLIAWLSCILIGAAFHRYVESRSRKIQESIGVRGVALVKVLRRVRPLQNIFNWLALRLKP